MFVPWTKGATLVGKLRSDEDRLARLTDFRMKYMEEGGMQLWRYFSTKLDAGQECGRVKCVLWYRAQMGPKRYLVAPCHFENCSLAGMEEW